MALLLLAAFIGVPLVEIAVFIQIGDLIGLGATLGLVLLTAVLGTWQLRSQGLATLQRARRQLDLGVVPAQELFDGVCLLFAGALLLTPGFVTDTIGFLLFLAPFRTLLRHALASRYGHIEVSGSGQGHGQQSRQRHWSSGEEGSGGGPFRAGSRSRSDDIIDGEYRDVTTDDTPDPSDPSERSDRTKEIEAGRSSPGSMDEKHR